MNFPQLLVFSISLILIFSCKSDNTPDSQEPIQVTSSELKNQISSKRSMALDLMKSKIHWSASKPGTRHNGTVTPKSGSIIYSGSEILSANVEMDMNTISVLDLTGDKKSSLESHLKGTVEGKEADFFDIRQYPTSEFRTTKVVKLANDSDYNYLIYGYLTIKDVIKEIAFKAFVEIKDDKMVLNSEEFSINRTEWGIHYLSKSIFGGLKDNFIGDEVKIKLQIEASADF